MAKRRWRVGFGSGFAFGETKLTEDGVIELSEADAAAFLQRRGAMRDIEVLGWVKLSPLPGGGRVHGYVTLIAPLMYPRWIIAQGSHGNIHLQM